MENRIKEQQLDLFADRTSAATMRAHQLRLYWALFAAALLVALRARALAGTERARGMGVALVSVPALGAVRALLGAAAPLVPGTGLDRLPRRLHEGGRVRPGSANGWGTIPNSLLSGSLKPESTAT